MKKTIHNNNSGLRFLIAFWSRHCELKDWHIHWAKNHVHIQTKLKKGQYLYLQGESQKNLYLVTRGIAARTSSDPDTDKRQILSIALPGMALMTTNHLYSTTPSIGDIQVLHSGTDIIQLPYRAIIAFKEQEPDIDTLADILGNKKRKQVMALHHITLTTDLQQRYILFANEMPELHTVLTNQECADLLGISIDTVHRAKKKWSKS